MIKTIAGAILLAASGIIFAIERAAANLTWVGQLNSPGWHSVTPGLPGVWDNPFVPILAAIGVYLLGREVWEDSRKDDV